LVSNGALFYVDSCEEAGQLMADGHCHRLVNCCYLFRGPLMQGDPEQDLCECTADPTIGGFLSCEDLAASHKDGRVIDLCPAYVHHAVVP